MEGTKILLSAEELQLVQNTQWLLTKNNIIEKAKMLFGELAANLQQLTEKNRHRLPDAVPLFSPKVFKGEYYQGLPYVMLDYPRIFTKDEVFAVRTMFWWGNFFSVTLQLKGSYQQLFSNALISNKKVLSDHGFCVSVSDDEWRHDFELDNYQSLTSDAPSDLTSDAPSDVLPQALRRNFFKLAVRIPLSSWNNAVPAIAKYHEIIMSVLTN
ncbi:MAG: hypothetical protein WCF67_07985 [Chitinophagaceae bacterium]